MSGRSRRQACAPHTQGLPFPGASPLAGCPQATVNARGKRLPRQRGSKAWRTLLAELGVGGGVDEGYEVAAGLEHRHLIFGGSTDLHGWSQGTHAVSAHT